MSDLKSRAEQAEAERDALIKYREEAATRHIKDIDEINALKAELAKAKENLVAQDKMLAEWESDPGYLALKSSLAAVRKELEEAHASFETMKGIAMSQRALAKFAEADLMKENAALRAEVEHWKARYDTDIKAADACTRMFEKERDALSAEVERMRALIEAANAVEELARQMGLSGLVKPLTVALAALTPTPPVKSLDEGEKDEACPCIETGQRHCEGADRGRPCPDNPAAPEEK